MTSTATNVTIPTTSERSCAAIAPNSTPPIPGTRKTPSTMISPVTSWPRLAARNVATGISDGRIACTAVMRHCSMPRARAAAAYCERSASTSSDFSSRVM